MKNEKELMRDAAILYYKKNYTQQQIANVLGISRQTVSRLLGLAVENKIVEIKINDPTDILSGLESALKEKFGVEIKVGACSKPDDALEKEATVKRASEVLTPILEQGNLKIGISWGRTIESVIGQVGKIHTVGNRVFPLFGATARDRTCYYANKLAYDLAGAIDGEMEYAMFPYLASDEDCQLIKKTSIYKNLESLWKTMDVSLVGIGDISTVKYLQDGLQKKEIDLTVTGDIATHLFNQNGEIVELYAGALCAPFEDIKKCPLTIGVAFGNHKLDCIVSAIKTGALDLLITDEFTGRELLKK